MRKNIVKIRKSDDLRAILTDALPYEVPLLFSNEGFYGFLKSNDFKIFKEKFNLDIFSGLRYTIPYEYKIKKNTTEYRSLSIMHPAQQIKTAKFYKDYGGIILTQCAKSNWSLRFPSSIATYYVEKSRAKRKNEGRTAAVESTNSGFDSVSRTASSYFTYKNYSFLYKFFESSDFHSLEKKFNILLKLDITQCFGRIYTHTIAWAVKDKNYAKKNLKTSTLPTFESEFDSLMQSSNYAETAGIIVGPEISRIFAEIILQQIDLNIHALLKNRLNPINCGTDYEIRRYVDDYFIFSNNQDCQKEIQRSISECLAPYRLSLNEAKSSCITRPFSTPETSIRIEIATVMSNVFDKAIEQELATISTESSKKIIFYPKKILSTEKLSNTTIRDIKRILKLHGASFDTSSNYFLSTVKRLITRYTSKIILSELDSTKIEWVANFLLAIIEIILFFYASSPRVRQTYILSEILLIIIEYTRNTSAAGIRDRIFTKISQKIKLLTEFNLSRREEDSIETINLLLVLQQLGPEYFCTPQQLLAALGLHEKNGTINTPIDFSYFKIVSLIYLSGSNKEFNCTKELAIDYAIKLFKQNQDWHYKSDLVMLLLDLTSCPHVAISTKTLIADTCLRPAGEKNINAKIKEFIEITTNHSWFFNWSSQIHLSDILQRKELRTPY